MPRSVVREMKSMHMSDKHWTGPLKRCGRCDCYIRGIQKSKTVKYCRHCEKALDLKLKGSLKKMMHRRTDLHEQ